MTEELDHHAGIGIAGNDVGTSLAALHQSRASGHAEVASAIHAGVATKAVLLENGPDVARVELGRGGVVRTAGHGRSGLIDGIAGDECQREQSSGKNSNTDWQVRHSFLY